MDPASVGARLGVRYLITGTVDIDSRAVNISVELATARNSKLIWSDQFTADLRDIQQARKTIVASIIAALELELPIYKASQSRRLVPNELDARSHFHLGLSHLYRFREDHNQKAAGHFDEALALDPGFARAHAGRSFTHWQTAFMRFDSDRQSLLERALRFAETALDLDPLDPFPNFNMGRARWLEGDVEGSAAWLDRALQLNPNYAHRTTTRA